MKTLLIVVSVLAACGGESAPVQAKPRPIKPAEFLRAAVLEGLKEDLADRTFLKECFEKSGPMFVLKCPICEQVQAGLVAYLNPKDGEKAAPPVEGKGIPKDILVDLKSPIRTTQLKAFERLIDRYVSRHYERLQMSAEERQIMHATLEDWKKTGMEMKVAGRQKDFDFCPSCNGAAKAK